VSHDQLFKDLLQAFFREFMELFFPTVAARLDFTQTTFLMQEVFTDIPTGEQRSVDLIAQVMTLDGAPELILIHLEVQADRRPNFPARMSEYYMLLRLRLRLPVLPIVVYLVPGAGGLTRETHTEAVFDRTVLRFEYEAVGLPDLASEDYLELNNPLAPALSALMRPGPTGRLAQKLQSLRRVLLSDVDEARKSLLVNTIETYLTLSATEELQFEALMGHKEAEEAREMLTIYEERGIIKGKRVTLIRLLRRKYGELPEDLEARVLSIQTAEELDVLLDRFVDARSLDEMRLS